MFRNRCLGFQNDFKIKKKAWNFGVCDPMYNNEGDNILIRQQWLGLHRVSGMGGDNAVLQKRSAGGSRLLVNEPYPAWAGFDKFYFLQEQDCSSHLPFHLKPKQQSLFDLEVVDCSLRVRFIHETGRRGNFEKMNRTKGMVLD